MSVADYACQHDTCSFVIDTQSNEFKTILKPLPQSLLCNEMLLPSLPFDARQIIVVMTRDKIVVDFFIIIIFCKDNQFEKDIVPLRREI